MAVAVAVSVSVTGFVAVSQFQPQCDSVPSVTVFVAVAVLVSVTEFVSP